MHIKATFSKFTNICQSSHQATTFWNGSFSKIYYKGLCISEYKTQLSAHSLILTGSHLHHHLSTRKKGGLWTKPWRMLESKEKKKIIAVIIVTETRNTSKVNMLEIFLHGISWRQPMMDQCSVFYRKKIEVQKCFITNTSVFMRTVRCSSC